MATKISLPSAVRRQALTSGEPLVKGPAWPGRSEVGGVAMMGVGVAVMGVGVAVMTGAGGAVSAAVFSEGVDREASLLLPEVLPDPQADARSRRQPAAKTARTSGTKQSLWIQSTDQ